MLAYYTKFVIFGIVSTQQVCLWQLPKDCLEKALKSRCSRFCCDCAMCFTQAWLFFLMKCVNGPFNFAEQLQESTYI